MLYTIFSDLIAHIKVIIPNCKRLPAHILDNYEKHCPVQTKLLAIETVSVHSIYINIWGLPPEPVYFPKVFFLFSSTGMSESVFLYWASSDYHKRL